VLALVLTGRRTGPEAVLISGAYGAGKGSVAEEIAFLLEQCGVLYALLDLDYLGWASVVGGSRAAKFRLMLRNHVLISNDRPMEPWFGMCSPSSNRFKPCNPHPEDPLMPPTERSLQRNLRSDCLVGRYTSGPPTRPHGKARRVIIVCRG
jgi:hypothetical protein